MNIASESAHSSIMARIAKVRERMLIELATGISASNKALFLPLCQHYEQQGKEKSFFTSYEDTRRPSQDFFSGHVGQGDNRPHWKRASMLEHNARQWLENINDWMDAPDFADWDKN